MTPTIMNWATHQPSAVIELAARNDSQSREVRKRISSKTGVSRFASGMVLAALLLVWGGCSNHSKIAPEKDAISPAPPEKAPTVAVTVTNTPVPKESVPQIVSPPVSNIKYVGTNNLNVRTGPGTENTSIEKLSLGTEVKVLDQGDDQDGRQWFHVEYEGDHSATLGWVAASYIVDSRKDLIHGDYAHLFYQPLTKAEHAGNPKREVKALYVTIYTAASWRINEILDLAAASEINALVIDVKNDRGQMLFRSTAAEQFNPQANRNAPLRDIRQLMEKLHSQGLYAIARIVTFKDPIFAENHPEKAILYARDGKLFRSKDGLLWASPYDEDFQKYNLAVAREAAAAGFNEVQFDYIRFPVTTSDTPLNFRDDSGRSKADVIQRFLLDAHEALYPLSVYTSADVFGLVCSVQNDVDIGQYWEAMSNAVDYISPMMYPSHYANGFYGFSVPDQYPYELLNKVVKDAIMRNRNIATPAQIRPWIQGFTAAWVTGHIHYGPREIKAQIRALEDNGIHSYLVWRPNNRYTAEAFR